MKEAAKRIMGVNPDIRITVAGGGSGVEMCIRDSP